MKNILIPSDFSVKSLACIDLLLDQFPNERLNLLFFHVFTPPDSITELMMLGREQKDFNNISYEFWYRCKQLEVAHQAQLNTIQVKCFYGSTVAVFKNFLDGHQIDLIVLPSAYQFRQLSKNSLDPVPFLDKCGKEVLVLTSHPEEEAFSRELDLLLNERS